MIPPIVRAALLVPLLAGGAGPAIAQNRPENRTMSSTLPSPGREVAAKLTAYDSTRDPTLLREAADAAALHDGEVPPDPATAITAARVRLADWVAILSRFQRDLHPGFDPNRPPPLNIVPPGEFGDQYAAGVNPKDVKDPEMRRAYIAAIEENRRRLDSFQTDAKLHEAHRSIQERAAASIADAHQTLGMAIPDIQAVVAGAAIAPADRSAVLAGLH